MTTLLIVLTLLAFGTLIFWFFKKKTKKTEQAPKPEAEKRETTEEFLEKLKDLNLKIRLEPGLEKEILQKTEEIVDKLWTLIPELSKNHSATELDWVVRKIAKNYLPELIDKFVKLAPEFRKENSITTQEALDSLLKELLSIEKMIGEHDALKLKGQALYLKERFFK